MANNPIEDPRTPEPIRRILNAPSPPAAPAAEEAELAASGKAMHGEVKAMATAVHALREALEEQQAKCGFLMKDNQQLQAAREATAAAQAASQTAEVFIGSMHLARF